MKRYHADHQPRKLQRAQTRRTVICQAVIIGAVGVIPGVGAGMLVAYLINILTGPSIGHPVGFGSHPYLLAIALVGGLFVTISAAWLRTLSTSRFNVVWSDWMLTCEVAELRRNVAR